MSVQAQRAGQRGSRSIGLPCSHDAAVDVGPGRSCVGHRGILRRTPTSPLRRVLTRRREIGDDNSPSRFRAAIHLAIPGASLGICASAGDGGMAGAQVARPLEQRGNVEPARWRDHGGARPNPAPAWRRQAFAVRAADGDIVRTSSACRATALPDSTPASTFSRPIKANAL